MYSLAIRTTVHARNCGRVISHIRTYFTPTFMGLHSQFFARLTKTCTGIHQYQHIASFPCHPYAPSHPFLRIWLVNELPPSLLSRSRLRLSNYRIEPSPRRHHTIVVSRRGELPSAGILETIVGGRAATLRACPSHATGQV